MFVLLLLIAVFVAALVVLLTVGLLVERRRRRLPAPDGRGWVERLEVSRVIVHTTTGQTYDGLLSGSFPDGLLLAGAVMVDTDTPLAGETFLPRERILMVQRPINVEGGDR